MEAKNDRKADSVSMQLNALGDYGQPKQHHDDVYTVRHLPCVRRDTEASKRRDTERGSEEAMILVLRISGSDDPMNYLSLGRIYKSTILICNTPGDERQRFIERDFDLPMSIYNFIIILHQQRRKERRPRKVVNGRERDGRNIRCFTSVTVDPRDGPAGSSHLISSGRLFCLENL